MAPALANSRPAFKPAPWSAFPASRRTAAGLAAVLLLYLVSAFALARTKVPWCDEGWFACPAYNLAEHGYLGTNVLEPSGHYLNAYLRGIRQRTYVAAPLHLVTLAGWFKTFGFSALSMRAYSIGWGAAALIATFLITGKLAGELAGVAAAGLTSADFVFLWGAADGRMDMMCAALGLGGIAAYLLLRERSVAAAIAVSQGLGAAACFTHPNGILAVLALAFLAWHYDRRRLRWRHLAWAAGPYFVFALGWSFYIVESPGDFRAQFFANAAGRESMRWKMVARPWIAVGYEVSKYFTGYGLYPIWTGKTPGALQLTPVLYALAAIGCWANRKIRGHPGIRVLLSLLGVYLAAMTFLVGFKAQNYLTYVAPVHAAVLGVWLLHGLRSAPAWKWPACAVAAAFLAIQISATVQKIRADEYHRDYQPIFSTLETYRRQGKTIVGTSALGFEFGFHGFDDDARLGQYTGKTPDVIVIDPWYRQWRKLFERQEPAVFLHVNRLVAERYHPVFRNRQFEIFERNAP